MEQGQEVGRGEKQIVQSQDVPGSVPGPVSSSGSQQQQLKSQTPRSTWQKIYDILSYTPRRCRYDPAKPFEFSMSLNVLFAFAGCFTVANLYYTHPILNILADDFNVTDEQASHIPTLAQAGYAGGLLLLCPPADLVKRRPFVLWLVWFTATMWLGLCITTSYSAFCAITFITGFTTVTPQLMLPLIGDLAPLHRRTLSLSIVVSGMLLGMLIARLLSGVVSLYIGWRYIYWISFGLQYLILILLWLFMPDYRKTNEGVDFWKKYPILLWDVIRMFFRHPVIAQACLVGLCTSSTFTSFWTTLTFLLAGPPYRFDSLTIGLFALVGIVAMAGGPIFARLVMEKKQPWFSVVSGLTICLVGVVVGTYAGEVTVAAPIIQAALLDLGLQTSQIANRTAIYGCEPKARNRVNTAYMVCVFIGQLIGTAVGNAIYARGGWVASGSANVAFTCVALLLCFIRGPHETGWIGWRGGCGMKRDLAKETQQEQRLTPQKGDDASRKDLGTEKDNRQQRPSIPSSSSSLSENVLSVDGPNTQGKAPIPQISKEIA